LKSSILVVGAGGLGSPALLYLAACGVGIESVFLFFELNFHLSPAVTSCKILMLDLRFR